MNARILCPGPSLARYAPGDFAGLLIGVNRAAQAQPCDVWASTDYPLVLAEADNVPGSPTLLTSGESARRVECVWHHPIVTLESLFTFLSPHNLPWTLYTMTAAIVFAAFRGATDVEIFGCDWTPGPDWDGHTDANTLATDSRQESRWELERGICWKLECALDARGVKVSRHGIA
jgi:hypothetical protein